jgi:hypothetical protein
MKSNDNPMNPAQRLQDAPRCHARAKSTGQPCKAPAVNGWAVCRVHGASGGAPKGKGNGMWRNGGRSLEATHTRRLIAELTRMAQEELKRLP